LFQNEWPFYAFFSEKANRMYEPSPEKVTCVTYTEQKERQYQAERKMSKGAIYASPIHLQANHV